MTTTATTAPDIADELHAGRPYPVRDFRVKLNSATARAHLDAIRAWWLDAAQGYCDLAQTALDHGDLDGSTEALADSQAAVAQAHRYDR